MTDEPICDTVYNIPDCTPDAVSAVQNRLLASETGYWKWQTVDGRRVALLGRGRYPVMQIAQDGKGSQWIEVNDYDAAIIANAKRDLRMLTAEVRRLWRVYRLFEEIAPPDVPRPVFVQWCFEAWERQDGLLHEIEVRDELLSELRGYVSEHEVLCPKRYHVDKECDCGLDDLDAKIAALNDESETGGMESKVDGEQIETKPSVRSILAARLREARENMGISDAGLAAAAGLPLSTVIEIECGERDTKAWELSKLATALHVDMFDLLREKPIDRPVVLWCGKRAAEEAK